MSTFLVIMCMGLAGLFVMALGGRVRHGHAGHGVAHGAHHGFRLGVRTGRMSFSSRLLRFIPEPRAVLSILTLFGAFGNLLERTLHLSPAWAAAGAVVVALALELAIIRPLWTFAFRFQGQPTSPLHALVMEKARATTPFRNGKGMVEVVHDGRTIQFAATMKPEQRESVVQVGDVLKIEDVDPGRERVIVSLSV